MRIGIKKKIKNKSTYHAEEKNQNLNMNKICFSK